MTNEELIALVNEDLKNERKHLAFYLQAGVLVQGMYRPELREFFLEESEGELKHCQQFADLVVRLGGIPTTEVNEYPADLVCPLQILQYVHVMELEVAENYAQRLRQTEGLDNSNVAYCHVFYESQLEDSWATAREVEQLIKKHEHGNYKGCV